MANPNDAFSRHGGRLSKHQFEQYINRVPLQSWEREYVKRVMEKFDNSSYSSGITREEFHKGLEEMAKNPRDRIGTAQIERIKKYF